MRRRGKSLGGRLGIPAERERTYVGVKLEWPLRAGAPQVGVPVAVTWPDGRSWPVERVLSVQEFGARALGNLVTRWNVLIFGRPKVLWSEGDRWFAVARNPREEQRRGS